MEAARYNLIGQHYNTTRQADPYLTECLFRLLAPQPNGVYLDIGCGTGNYTRKLAEKGVHFWGVDPSEIMLAEARQVRDVTQPVTWLTGTAAHIPAPDHTFSGAVATLTIHHWPDLVGAFAELHWVLVPGSQLVMFTALPEQMEGYWLNHYFPDMLRDSIIQMPSLDRITEAATGFTCLATEPYFVRPDLTDMFLYAGKHRPSVYLDPLVRHGISSFASLAQTDEVERGLAQLQSDLDAGSFFAIQQTFDNQLGDYLFISILRQH